MILVDKSTYCGHQIEIYETKAKGNQKYIIYIDGFSRRTTNTLSNAQSIARIVAGGDGPKL
jgi:hypothetical protein